MADKHFKVKNNVQVSDLTTAGPVTVGANGVLESHTTLAIDKGGTGQTTAANAINALLPSQTSNTSKILGTDGTNVTWVNPGASYQTSAPSNPVTGQLWVDSDETGDSLDPYIIRRKTITATAGQTVFTTDVVFTDGYEQVYYNGVLLVRTTDYTTSGGTNTVTLLQGASAGDTVEIISSTPINLVNTVVTGAANTITAASTSTVPLTIAGLSSQTANLFEIKNNTGEVRHQMSPLGVYISRGNAADGAAIVAERYDNSDPVAVLALRGYGGTVSAPASVSENVRVGLVSGEGWDGTAIRSIARITFNVDGPVSTGVTPGRITFNTVPLSGGAHIERMRIHSNGNVSIGSTSVGQKLSVNGSMDAVHEDGAAMGVRIKANASNNSAALQFTNNSASADWAYINSTSANKMIIRSAVGGNTAPYDAWLHINGGPVHIRDVRGDNGEASDWPVPTLSIQSYDDYFENTMFGMFLRDDNPYTLDFSKWVMRLSGTSGQLTSNSSTNLKFGGPGDLILLTGNSEKMRIRSDGHVWLGSAGDVNWHLAVVDSTAGAGAFLSTTSTNVHSGLFESTKTDYAGVQVRIQAVRSNISAYRFLDAFSSAFSGADLEFNLRGDGQAYADGSWNSGGADYAEYFEWADGNPNNEDRRGYSVSLIGKKIKLAEEGEPVIGVISGNPSIIGDSGWNIWNKKYLVDDFGSYIRDENGERILNSDYDPEQEYVAREDRPEWAIVGLMGKLRLRKGQPVASNWIKMDDISAEVEEWLVR